MQIVVLDYPQECEDDASWEALRSLGTVIRFRHTSLPELLERARTADILITRRFPFRREVLDYITRPRLILVPGHQLETLVETSITRQLGIQVAEFPDEDPPCGWIQAAAATVRRAVP
ncbi:MAG: hypothetical protein ACOCYB_07925 [Alkalispirochaeta sp.]